MEEVEWVIQVDDDNKTDWSQSGRIHGWAGVYKTILWYIKQMKGCINDIIGTHIGKWEDKWKNRSSNRSISDISANGCADIMIEVGTKKVLQVNGND